MNELQTLFTAFFAIFWGTSANAWPARKPFAWALLVGHPPIFRRVVLSVLALNVVPLAYFAWVYGILSFDCVKKALPAYWMTVVAVTPAFAAFGFYRVWLGATQLKPGLFYYEESTTPPSIDRLPEGVEPFFESGLPQRMWAANVAVGTAYLVVSTAPLLLLLWVLFPAPDCSASIAPWTFTR